MSFKESAKGYATGIWNSVKSGHSKLNNATGGYASASIGATVGGVGGMMAGVSGQDGSATRGGIGLAGGAVIGALSARAPAALRAIKRMGVKADDATA
jgi:hypothetical protein